MIYPPNAHIDKSTARALVVELYTLENIESWHVLEFTKKHNVVVTTKEEIETIALRNGLYIPNILSEIRCKARNVMALVACLLLSFNISAQVKPITDSIKFVQGVSNSYNVLTNDIGTNLKVTSFSVSGIKKDTGKIANIQGIGSISINGRGLLSFKPFNDTFSGYLPEISYIANNTLARGVSAKVIINITKRVKPIDTNPAFRIYKSNNQLLVDYGGIIYVGELNAYYDGCKYFYCVIADNAIYPLSKQQYDLLNK